MTRIAKILAEEGLLSPDSDYRKRASEKKLLDLLLDTMARRWILDHSVDRNKFRRAFPEALSRGNWVFSYEEGPQDNGEEQLPDGREGSRWVEFLWAGSQEIVYSARIPLDKLFRGVVDKLDPEPLSKVFQEVYKSQPEEFENLVTNAIRKAGLKGPEEIARQYFDNTVEHVVNGDFQVLNLDLEAQPPELSFKFNSRTVDITLKVDVITKDVDFTGEAEPEESDEFVGHRPGFGHRPGLWGDIY